jgi:transposase-like protein
VNPEPARAEKPRKARRLTRRFTPQRKAEAVLLVAEDGLSYAKAAEAIGASPAGVYQWVRKAGLRRRRAPSEIDLLRAQMEDQSRRIEELERRLNPESERPGTGDFETERTGSEDNSSLHFAIPPELDYANTPQEVEA